MIETELQALGYEYMWQQKRWRVWRDSIYVGDFSPDLHQEERPGEELSACTPGKGSPYPRAAPLGDFMEVARRSKGQTLPSDGPEAHRPKQRCGVGPPENATPRSTLR